MKYGLMLNHNEQHVYSPSIFIELPFVSKNGKIKEIYLILNGLLCPKTKNNSLALSVAALGINAFH